MKIQPEIFRQYDIRGIVNKDLTPETVELLGKGIGSYFRTHGKKQVALGWDCRLSSKGFSERLTDGLRSTGCSVVHLGTSSDSAALFLYLLQKYGCRNHDHRLPQPL